MERSRSLIATPSGATIREQILLRNMRQKEFAVRMGMSEKHISKLINGEVQLTIDMARRLELVLGIPTQFWCNLETIYREKLAKIADENEMDTDLIIEKKYPYDEMAQNGWVVETRKPKDRVSNLRKYFEVVQLGYLENNLIPIGIKCRRQMETEKNYYALVAWTQKAKIESRNIETQPIDINQLKIWIPQIVKMTKSPMKKFCNELSQLLAKCGIAIVFLPQMSEMLLHGATFYEGAKIVLGLTTCENNKEEFLFSLFHELGHIVLGHLEKVEGTTKEDEEAADEYAKMCLNNKRETDKL